MQLLASAVAMKNPSPIEPVLRCLRAVRRRLVAQAFLERLAAALLIAAGVLVAAGAWRRWTGAGEPWDAAPALWAGAAAVVVALGVTLLRVPRLTAVAHWLDRAAETRDRLYTALAFHESAGEPHTLAVQECSRYAARTDFTTRARLRWPGRLGWLVVPALALAFLQWEARMTAEARATSAAAAREIVDDPARQLEELARKMEQGADSEELKKLAEELRRRAERLRAEAKNPEDAEKAALREISELENLVREMQKQPSASRELQELAKALQQSEKTQAAADALRGGDLAKAAEELEKSLRELAKNKDERTPEAVKQALEQALKHLAEQRQLSEQMQQLRQQMQQGGAASQTMKQLAEALRKMGGDNNPGIPPSPGGRPMTEQEMKALLAALQNMKNGENQQSKDGPSRQGQGLAIMESFAPADGRKPGQPGDRQMSAGNPGTENDKGTTNDPLGHERDAAGKNARAQQLAGRLGDGETLQQFLPSAGDASRSGQRYREIYQAMAPAAEEAVLQENIPLGSRFFIKRYFEAIRPAE
jgi:hypothetical protein